MWAAASTSSATAERDAEDELALFDRPRRPTDQCEIGEITLGLLDELFSSFSGDRWQTSLLYRLRTFPEPFEHRVDVEFGHPTTPLLAVGRLNGSTGTPASRIPSGT